MGYDEALDKAMDAAKAGDAESAKTALQAALQAAKNDADKAFVKELLEDVDKGDLGEVAEDIERYLNAGSQAPTFADLLDKAMDAAKAGDADKAKEELTEALDLASSDADKANSSKMSTRATWAKWPRTSSATCSSNSPAPFRPMKWPARNNCTSNWAASPATVPTTRGTRGPSSWVCPLTKSSTRCATALPTPRTCPPSTRP